jgi:malate synthase
MTGPSEEATLAVVVSRIDDLREDVQHLRTDLADVRTGLVSRGEWEQRNNHVDSRFQAQSLQSDTRHQQLGREIGELRTEIRARQAPWWSVAAVIVAGVALAWNIIGPIL